MHQLAELRSHRVWPGVLHLVQLVQLMEAAALTLQPGGLQPGVAAEHQLAHEHLPQDQTKAEHVCAGAVGLAAGHLRRRVVWMPGGCHARGPVAAAEATAHTKVGHHRRAQVLHSALEQNVLRGEVAVDHVLRVHVRHADAHVQRDAEHLVHGERSAACPDVVRQRAALHELEHQTVVRFGAHAQQPHHGRTLRVAQVAHLTRKHLPNAAVAVRAQLLHRHEAAPVARQPHVRERAAAQLADRLQATQRNHVAAHIHLAGRTAGSLGQMQPEGIACSRQRIHTLGRIRVVAGVEGVLSAAAHVPAGRRRGVRSSFAARGGGE
mmetsp:Transcript_11683/g.29510  ORF Transcript_11683/g.29510 Transcript_11683/m.29510 type:complete len:322 (+) Transcript_11683:399-1364(+)